MDLTLDQLLASIEGNLTKSASDDESKDEDKKDEKKPFPFQKKDGDEKKESKSDCDDEDEKSDKDSEGQKKEASVAGKDLAREVMQKVASINLDKNMNKQASTAGQALARALLKQSSAGDIITEDGIAPGAVPTKNQVDNAQMEAEGASYIKPMVTGDGVRNSGTVNEIFDAMIADALSQGAASTDQVHGVGVAAQEGNVEDHALPNQVKVAAMNGLMSQGFDFDTASEIVKSAKDHMLKGFISPAWQENAIAKDHGKEGLKGFVDNAGTHFAGTARASGRSTLESLAGATAGGAVGAGVAKAGDILSKRGNPTAARVGAAVGALGGYVAGSIHGAHKSLRNQASDAHKKYASEIQVEDELEKAAAVSELVAQGINFDDAFKMVKQAEAEILFEMEKTAAMNSLMAEGVSFEDAIQLVKEASAGDMTTENGIAPGAVPTKNQADNAQSEAEGASYIKPMPTGDGVRNAGSVNQIFDAIVADATSQGAASYQQDTGSGVAGKEGNVEDHAVPNQVKVAAMNELLAEGIDFDEAAEIVKEASAVSMIAGAGKLSRTAQVQGTMLGAKARLKDMASGAADMVGKTKANASLAATRAKADGKLLLSGETGGHTVTVNSKGRASSPRVGALGRLASNGLVQGAAGAGAVGAAGGAYALSREKKAAFDALVEAGVDYASAGALVEEKAHELYGE